MRKNLTPNLRHRLEYTLVRSVVALVGCLSWSQALGLGRGIGRLFRRLDARHRRIVRENLRRADLGLDEAGLQRVSIACFEHFGALFCSMLRLLNMEEAEIRGLLKVEGLEHYDRAMAEGKGVIALTGHFGNWEMLGLGMSLAGRPVEVIGRELDNPLLEAYLKRLRTRFGNSVIPKDGAVRESLKLLKKGKAIGFLLDQDALGMGLFVRYFDHWASTFSTAGMLADRYDLPVLPCSSHVDAKGITTVRVHPPFHIPHTGVPDRDIWVGTQMMTAWIEAQVRQEPTQWFWMHRRFKTQPGYGNSPLPDEAWLPHYEASKRDLGLS